MESGEGSKMRRTFFYTLIIGALVVIAAITGTTLWMSAGAHNATDQAMERLNEFYLHELAERRSQVVSGFIDTKIDQMRRTIDQLSEDDLESQETLRAFIGKAEELHGMDVFAIADEDDVVYRAHITYMGGSRYDFLSREPADEVVISTTSYYGAHKYICIALPVYDRTFLGRKLKTCFVEININDIVSMLAFDAEDSNTFFGLYYRNGENLTDLDLSSLNAKENLLEVMGEILPEEQWKILSDNFNQGKGGGVEFNYSGSDELLYYVPIPRTNWMMTILINKNLIHDQIRGISDETLMRSTVQIMVTILVLMLYFSALGIILRRSSRVRLEQEKLNTQAAIGQAELSEARLGEVRKIATRDALTYVGNKYAYTQKEEELNALIRSGGLEQFAIMVCDLNGLKQINDTKGHAAGDEYIRQASRMICNLYAHSPVYRIGGDEFVVILQKDDFGQKESLLAELNRRSERNIDAGGVVIAAGMAEYEEEDSLVEEVFHRADQRMYARKKQLKETRTASK